MNKSNLIVETKDLVKDYFMGETQVRALDHVNIKINAGDMASIMGPSGSGKSTLMNILGCLDKPTEGEYYLDGVAISSLNAAQLADLRHEKIGFVFQSFNLLPRLNAAQNVALPLIYSGKERNKRHEKAMEILELVGLEDRWDHLPTQLSGGQQQRVAIARSLVNNPKLLLADEPTGALDTKTGDDIIALFKKLNQEGLTIMIVTHNPAVAELTPRIIEVRDGLILEQNQEKQNKGAAA
jgi:putative ABC transport system ATP-binding protein